MILADYIAIALIVFSVLTGIFRGFGKTLRNITDGVVGKIISIVITYFLFGLVVAIPFVSSLLNKLVEALKANGSWICNLLLKVRIDMIVLAVVLFFIVQILRKIFFNFVCDVFESQNGVVKVFNMVLGAVLVLALTTIFVLIAFQIAAWIDGTTNTVYKFFEGSKLKLDVLFKDNPLNAVFENIKKGFFP